MSVESVRPATDPKQDLPLVRFLTAYIPSQYPYKGHEILLSEVLHVPPYSEWGGAASGGTSRPLVLSAPLLDS